MSMAPKLAGMVTHFKLKERSLEIEAALLAISNSQSLETIESFCDDAQFSGDWLRLATHDWLEPMPGVT